MPVDFQDMANIRANVRRDKEGIVEQQVPLQVPHKAPPQDPIYPSNMSNVEIRSDFKVLD